MKEASQRIALYSHDALGLGHVRRNLLVAEALLADRSRAILLITGAREVGEFAMPPGVDCLALPALRKAVGGRYQARSLALSLESLVRLRAETIRAALASFRPHVLIVDKHPLGVQRELEPSLQGLRAGSTRLILGLRDVLDAPAVVRREWRLDGSEAAIRDHYDAVWVYGDPRIYDPVAEYGLPQGVATRVRYTGYLARTDAGSSGRDSASPRPLAALGLPPGRLALCLVGGGEDGYRLADAFARTELPPGMNAVMLTGPFMPAEDREVLRRRAAGTNLRVLRFVENPAPLFDVADAVVAMGGYNTDSELISRGKRALIVPRVGPRQEQLIRAERMRDLGLLDLLDPDELGPRALGEWLAREQGPPPGMRERIDLDGLGRLPALLDEALASAAHADEGLHLAS